MLGEFLGGENFSVQHAHRGDEGLACLDARPFDLVVLDVMMPGLDGFGVLAHLRRRSDVPVLMLTARGDDDDRIAGLELGADDYLAKPFNPRELVARIRAILRRRDSAAGARKGVLMLGPLTLDSDSFLVSLDGRQIRLTSQAGAMTSLMTRASLLRAPTGPAGI